jgi:hypothetical protein
MEKILQLYPLVPISLIIFHLTPMKRQYTPLFDGATRPIARMAATLAYPAFQGYAFHDPFSYTLGVVAKILASSVPALMNEASESIRSS